MKTKLIGFPIYRIRKLLITTMKIFIFFFCILTFGFSSEKGLSQNTKIVIPSDGELSIEEVFDIIKKQTDHTFIYKSNLFENTPKITIKKGRVRIKDLLGKFSTIGQLDFQFADNGTIFLRKKPKRIDVLQPQQTVTGTVTDADGVPLFGANIVEKGTMNGVTVDFDGNFSLEIADENATLIVSYIGFATKEVALNGQSTINVSLEESAAGLDEVVVVGYGTVKKSDLTGSVSSVTTEATEDIPNTNILQSLSGRVAGLSSTVPNRPGEESSVNIRGINSLSASNTPLIVVDGIIYNGSINDFSVNDIEKIDILKDASAAAVYGSRSSNGVILITTKMGKTNKPMFNFNTYYGISNPVSLIPILDGPGYIQKVLDYRQSVGLEANPNNVEDYLLPTEASNYRNGSTVDWYDKIVKSGITKNNNISISGKTEKTSYYFSGTFFNQSGIVKNDDFDRFTLKANFKNEITDWYTLSLRTGFTSLDYSGVAADLFYGYSPYGSYWEDESLNIYKPFPTEDFYKQHPMINTQIDNRDVSTSVLGTLSSQLKIPFIKGLKWTLNYSTNLRSRRIDNFWNNTLNIGSGTTLNGNASKQIVDNYDWTLDNIINYNRLFNKKHSVDITLLYSREYQRYEKTFAGANDFINQGLGYNNLSLGKLQQSDSDLQDQNSVAYMARLNYVYNNKYALTASIRRDGFSSFSKSHKYATFPSLALAWTASNESFLETTSWLNTLKFRVSYGENGNQALGRYQTLSRIQNSQYLFGDGSDTEGTVFVESIANNDLGWETTKVVNFGMDFGFLQNRLRGTVDLYSSNTYNILLQRNIPATTGYSTVWTNLGKVHNKGIEFTLNSANISGDNLSWETGFVFSLNRNRIDELLGEDVDGDGKEDDIVANSWFIGSPLGVVFGYKTNGIYQTGEEAPSGFKAGDFRLVDNNDDGEITPDDRMILGTTLPNYVFSISNTFKYKNLSLYIMFNSIQGGGKDNSYIGNNMAMHNVNNPFPTWAERFNVQDVPYWTPENPSNDYPSINYVPTRNHPYLEDRSFVRLQDITISYNFDSSIFENLPINGLRTYVSGKNIYTWTKWTGYDPEIQTSIGDFPTLRTITMGLDVRF